MATDEKIAANRRNALRSTGPRTPEGKARSSQNASKHGLLSREILLPGEDREALEALRENLISELQPTGTLELMLVDRIIVCVWRMRRIHVLESGVFECNAEEPVEKLLRHSELSPAGLLAKALIKDSGRGNQLSNLSRYEAMWERGLFRALHELQRLQAARLGQSVEPPMAVDVILSSGDGEASTSDEGTMAADETPGAASGVESNLRNEASAPRPAGTDGEPDGGDNALPNEATTT